METIVRTLLPLLLVPAVQSLAGGSSLSLYPVSASASVSASFSVSVSVSLQPSPANLCGGPGAVPTRAASGYAGCMDDLQHCWRVWEGSAWRIFCAFGLAKLVGGVVILTWRWVGGEQAGMSKIEIFLSVSGSGHAVCNSSRNQRQCCDV